jgi:hypothetical protein
VSAFRGGWTTQARCWFERGGSCFPESHAATVKVNVIAIEKTMGMIKKYFQSETVMVPKIGPFKKLGFK